MATVVMEDVWKEIAQQALARKADLMSTSASTGVYLENCIIGTANTAVTAMIPGNSGLPQMAAPLGLYGGGSPGTGLATQQPKIVQRRRLTDGTDTRYGSTSWASFVQEGGDWYIVSRTDGCGYENKYWDSTPRSSLKLEPGNHYLKRLQAGEGVYDHEQLYIEGTTANKREVSSSYDVVQRHELYAKLNEKVQKIETLLGLSGEAKHTDDLLLALAERVQEIEDYLENRQ